MTIKEIVIQDQKDEQSNGYDTYLQDVTTQGCVSGMVGGLIHYSDTVKFFNYHKLEINAILTEMLDSTGCSISELFGEKWDNNDPLAMEQLNQNLLAWFAYEETARAILEEQSIEV